MRLVAVLLTGAALLAGCASGEFSPSGTERFAPHSGEVTVLERLPPHGAYHLVGIVTVSGVALTSDARMFDMLKARAARHGADAVVLQAPIRERVTAAGGEERTLAAYAIRRR